MAAAAGRWRGTGNWNVEYIAGLEIGVLCPDCQTPEESLGAEVNLVLSPPSQWQNLNMNSDGAIEKFIEALLSSYPTPDVLRTKARVLARARKDPQASEMVRFMRHVADIVQEQPQSPEDCALDIQEGLNASGWPEELSEMLPILDRGGCVAMHCPACSEAGAEPHVMAIRKTGNQFVVQPVEAA
ncbi:MAG: hypothetical protein FGM52_11555 [Mycobacterium sp.]|nr:hypothetical protein [Mycobacterium sp.]